ncbi:MAG: zinc-ribbon domain-containing protein [Evtepia gabavorous]
MWWQCGSGHVWAASGEVPGGGRRLPLLYRPADQSGENDLATLYPALARQWHPTKNGGLTPAAVAPGSRRRVWWQCPQGHTWQAAVFSRSQGADCPVRTGRDGAAGGKRPGHSVSQLARQWDQERNGALTPQQVSPYSNRAVWWRCGLGHSWHAAISTRAWGSDCPYCAGRKVLAGFNDLATRYPELAQTWDPVLNGALTPAMVYPGKPQEGVVAVPGEPRGKPWSTPAPATNAAAVRCVPGRSARRIWGGTRFPLFRAGRRKRRSKSTAGFPGWKPKQCNQRRRQKI